MKLTGCSAVAALRLLVPGPVGTQEAPGRLPGPESTTVLVDVVARDKKGLPVTGPSASDFELLEDGVPQRVSQFSLVSAPHTASLTVAFVFDRLSPEGRAAAAAAVRELTGKKGCPRQGAAGVPVVVSVPGRALSTVASGNKGAGVDLTLLPGPSTQRAPRWSP